MKKILLFITVISLLNGGNSFGSCLPDMDYNCIQEGMDDADAGSSCGSFGVHEVAEEQYATADDGTPLMWTAYLPSGSSRRTALVLINVGCFKKGQRGPNFVAEDLANSGFVVLSIDYRGDCSLFQLPGQNCLAYSPEYSQNQISDVKKAIHAARAGMIATGTSVVISRINGKVGAVGGSAGASHALWCAVSGTAGDDKLDAAALLSGVYKFDDSTSLMDLHFSTDVDRYCRTSPSDPNPTRMAHLHAGSPIYAITGPTVASPLLFFGRADDPATPTQLTDLQDRLVRAGATNFQSVPLPAANDQTLDHAFEYWCVNVNGQRVDQQVIGWLHTQLPN